MTWEQWNNLKPGNIVVNKNTKRLVKIIQKSKDYNRWRVCEIENTSAIFTIYYPYCWTKVTEIYRLLYG